MGATSGVDRSRQPPISALRHGARRHSDERRRAHGRSSWPQRPRVLVNQRARRAPEGTRYAVRHRSVEPVVSEPKPTDSRAEVRAVKPPATGTEALELATPRSRPRLAEAARGVEPSHLLDHLGEPGRAREMTSGTALVACHLRVGERPAEVVVAARSPLRGADRRGLSAHRARPACHETPRLPRATAARLAANDRLPVLTCASPVSTVQQLERLQAAGSSPRRQVGAAHTCLRRLPLRKQREDIRNTSTNLAHHQCK